MAEQICYAVLCVFSYFAAGQEQKKAILEQAARVPLASATPATSTTPINVLPSASTSPQPERRSPEVRNSEMSTGEGRSLKDPGGGIDPMAVGEQSRGAPRGGPQRTGSLPPRRPPPPLPTSAPPAGAQPSPHSSPQHPPQQRLSRAHSQAAPPRPHDPPLIPPRTLVTSVRPTGIPPALPPRQLSAAADLNVTSRGPNSGTRRQASATATFAATNPFTSPRQTEFVIPQRNNIRRSSTTDRS